MTSARQGLARSVQVRLVRHAKAIGVDPNFVLTRYAVERFLYRLSRSAYAEEFVLKGALLLFVWLGETHRPTRDADLLGFGDLSDDALVNIFREVCNVEVEPDAATFLSDTVRAAPIREDDAYGGSRVTLKAWVGTAQLTLQVDIGFGDAVTPEPEWAEYPSLLDLPRPRLRVYPRETVVAEKLHAMVYLGARTSRMKDYFDVHALLQEEQTDTGLLGRAIAATFRRRRTDLPDGVPPALSVGFASDAAKQAQWRAFLRKSRIDAPALEVVVADIRERLAEPLAKAHEREAGA
jgi:predicted nucleotidyltransferase component of viral defense system